MMACEQLKSFIVDGVQAQEKGIHFLYGLNKVLRFEAAFRLTKTHVVLRFV